MISDFKVGIVYPNSEVKTFHLLMASTALGNLWSLLMDNSQVTLAPKSAIKIGMNAQSSIFEEFDHQKIEIR